MAMAFNTINVLANVSMFDKHWPLTATDHGPLSFDHTGWFIHTNG
jgi:hypothetical protein